MCYAFLFSINIFSGTHISAYDNELSYDKICGACMRLTLSIGCRICLYVLLHDCVLYIYIYIFVCYLFEYDVMRGKGEHQRTVRHFHYVEWPDMKVPDTVTMLEFVRTVRDHVDSHTGGPFLVHCRYAPEYCWFKQ